MRGRALPLIVLTIMISVIAAGTVVLAAGGDPVRQQAVRAPTITGTGSGGGCSMGFDTETGPVTPPDDSTGDNTPAAVVILAKPCSGPVVGQFASEATIASGGFIHLDMRATCIGSGGFTNHCSVGQQVSGRPGHTFFDSNAGTTETHAMNMVWVLRPGQWRFEVLPGAGGASSLGFRTFTVEAFAR